MSAGGSPALSHHTNGASVAPSQSPQETEAMRQAVLTLVNVWLSRLSLMSGITTFFAGIDGQLLAYAYPSTVTDSRTDTGYRIAVTSLAGAMILHWMAAIISYIACFSLYRYELTDARHEERSTGLLASTARYQSQSPTAHSRGASKSSPLVSSSGFSTALNGSPALDSAYVSVRRFHLYTLRTTRPDPAILGSGTNASVELPVTPGIPRLPLDLCGVNNACVAITFVGFVLAILGILAYMWAFLPSYVSIFASVCLGVSMAVGIWVLR